MIENVGIQKLLLNSTNIGDEGAKAISDMLKKNKTICVIQLSNNTMEYSGFASIAEALLENNTLRSLYLNGNYGGPLGASSLAKGVVGNKSLRGRSRSWISVTTIFAQKVLFMLLNSSNGRSLYGGSAFT